MSDALIVTDCEATASMYQVYKDPSAVDSLSNP